MRYENLPQLRVAYALNGAGVPGERPPTALTPEASCGEHGDGVGEFTGVPRHLRRLPRRLELRLVQLDKPADQCGEQRFPAAEVRRCGAGRQTGSALHRTVGQTAHPFVGEHPDGRVGEDSASISSHPPFYTRSSTPVERP